MRNTSAIVLRKIRGVFGACFKGRSYLIGGGSAGPAMATGRGMLAAAGVLFAAMIGPLVAMALLVLALLFTPAHAGVSLADGAVAAGATAAELITKLNASFSEFRSANDERIKALEKGQTPDALLLAKQEQANNSITELQAQLAEVREQVRLQETAQARLNLSASDVRDADMQDARRFFSLTRGKPVASVTADDLKEYQAYKGAFAQYLRQGERALANTDIRNGLATGTAPGGGFWLTPDSSGKIVEFLEDLSSMRRIASVSPIGTDTFEGNYDLDEASSGWVGESASRPETNAPRIDGKYSFPIFEQYAAPKSTQKMLDDSENDVEAWLAKKVAQKLAKTENTAFVTGNGISRPKGFTDYAAGTPARTSVANYRKIRQIVSGASGAFLAAASAPGDKFIDMIQAIPQTLRSGAVFAMNALTVAEVRKLKDVDGNYLFIPDFSKNPNGSILGYAVEELNDMADIAANSLSIAFGNFREAYEIKDHVVGTSVLRDPYTDKPNVIFYTTKRVGGDVVNFQGIVLMKFST